MKILSLSAANFKRLKVVEITPTGAIVDVNGKNAQGKTSVLDSILAALGGKSELPRKPIRKGETKARITVKLGDGKQAELVVTRTFQNTKDGDDYTTSITVEDAKGAVYRSPQTLLDGLLGGLSFDPLAFTRMDAKDQLQELRKLVPDFDFEAADAKISDAYARRTEVNREAKRLKALIDGAPIPGDPRVVRVDEAALVAELNSAGEKKAEIERQRAARASLQNQIKARAEYAADERADAARYQDKIAELRAEIVNLEKMVNSSQENAALAEQDVVAQKARYDALPPLPEPPDTSALVARIDAARKTNADVAERERAIQVKTEREAHLKDAEAESERLSGEIEAAKRSKADAVAAAKLPVAGLSFGDNEVLLNGLPFEQASGAEQIRASVAIAAAMAPTLKVIRVQHGNDLDEDGLKLLAEFAEQHDYQIWIESVSNGKEPVGFVLEDGMVKAFADSEVAA